MRRINTFFYGLGQGIKNIFRNRTFSMASIGTMAACLFLFGIFYTALMNFQYMVKGAETNVGVTVFFEAGITDEEIDAMKEKISMRAEVYKIEYTSAEQAWEEYKATKLSPELAATFGSDNPLSDSASFTVYLNDVSMQDSLVKFIKGIQGVRKVNDAAGLSDNLAGINKIIAAVSVVIIVVLLAVAAFLINITISTGVSVRKQEISIMKLIGASNFFIRIPFIVEGILIGLVGALIPLLIIRFSYLGVISILEGSFSSMFNVLNFMGIDEIMNKLIPITLLIGMGTGFIGSNLTLRKQLKKIEVN